MRQWQSYTAKEVFDFAAELPLTRCFTPVHSLESNGIAQIFVKTSSATTHARITCRMPLRLLGQIAGCSTTTTRATLTRGPE
jgi:hypothetical protein